MSDALYHGRRFRTLNGLDEEVREALDIVIDTGMSNVGGLPSAVVREQLQQQVSTPKPIYLTEKPTPGVRVFRSR